MLIILCVQALLNTDWDIARAIVAHKSWVVDGGDHPETGRSEFHSCVHYAAVEGGDLFRAGDSRAVTRASSRNTSPSRMSNASLQPGDHSCVSRAASTAASASEEELFDGVAMASLLLSKGCNVQKAEVVLLLIFVIVCS